MEEVKNEISPKEYFEGLKNGKQTIDDAGLTQVYDNCLQLLAKYKITGQTVGIEKLIFIAESIEKERKLVLAGIDTFVYKDDIELYIQKVASDAVKIIEIERYERDIPSEIVDVIKEYKGLFDQLYIVFTDYTGKAEKKVAKERRDNDPILFGTFQDKDSNTLVDRFYYLGDWEDEYCDLTLSKMVNESMKHSGKDIRRYVLTPKDMQDLKGQVASLKSTRDGAGGNGVRGGNGGWRVITYTPKHTVVKKIKTFLGIVRNR